ncbi:hypothetical protein Tco_0385160 [Tanacetum coccineum]
MLKGAYFGAKTKTFEDYSILTNTPYPGKETLRISANSSQENAYKKFPIWRIPLMPYVVKMDDPNITMEEYIRLEEEKAHRRATVFNDTLMSEPTVSSLNNEIDFRISFDESEDEDYTPTVSYFNDLDFFKDFEKEFPAIVYNDALTSKSDFLTEPTVSPQHIDKFNLKDETSLSEYKDNDDDKIDIKQSSGDMSVIPLPNVINMDVGAYAHGSNMLLKTKLVLPRDELVLLSQQLVLLEENSSYCSRLQLPVLNQSVNTGRITVVGEKVNAAESLLVVSTEVNAD